MIGLLPFRNAARKPGQWTIVSNVQSGTYPAGIQANDVIVLLEAFEKGSSVTTPGFPTVAPNTTVIMTDSRTWSTGGSGTTYYRRASLRVSYKIASGSESGTGVGGSYDTRTILVFRLAPVPTAPTLTTVGTGTEVAATVSDTFSLSGHSQPLFAFVAAAAYNTGGAPTHTIAIDGVTPTTTVTLSTSRSRITLAFTLPFAYLNPTAYSIVTANSTSRSFRVILVKRS